MAALPRPTAVFDTFWWFAAERHKIWQTRRSGQAAPWTADPQLARHKFCNVYRALDRNSQYCITTVINLSPPQPEEWFFRVLLFKFYNRIATWELLETALGPLTWKTFKFKDYASILDAAYNRGEHLFGSAYRANQKYRLDLTGTHLRYLSLLDYAMRSDTLARLLAAESYEACFWVLRGLPLHGDFTGMQHLVDLNYSPLLNGFDEDDFVRAGPGCVAGINLCFGIKLSPKSASDMLLAARVVRDCVDNQEKYFQAINEQPMTLFGRRLKLIDCQSLFCEISKFSKLSFPHLHSQGATARSYDPTSTSPLPPLVLPAKWRRFP